MSDIREDLADAAAGLSNVMRLAEVRSITPIDAARLVLKELGWENGAPTYEGKDGAYRVAKAIWEKADEMGAPMNPERIWESGA